MIKKYCAGILKQASADFFYEELKTVHGRNNKTTEI